MISSGFSCSSGNSANGASEPKNSRREGPWGIAHLSGKGELVADATLSRRHRQRVELGFRPRRWLEKSGGGLFGSRGSPQEDLRCEKRKKSPSETGATRATAGPVRNGGRFPMVP